MQKFTIFTILLTGLVVVVTSEIVVNEYLPQVQEGDLVTQENLELDLPDSLDLSKTIGTSVLGADAGLSNYLGSDVEPSSIDEPQLESIARVMEDTPSSPELSEDVSPTEKELEEKRVNFVNPLFASDEPEQIEQIEQPSSDNDSGLTDFEDTSTQVVKYSPNVYLREEQLRSAGFVSAYLEETANSGLLYKTIAIDDLEDVTVNEYLVRTDNELLAKVYVLKTGINLNINDIYSVIKTRASSGLNVEVNETNDFGINSFYMNDNSRPNTAFLTVRVGGLIYGFSYPKTYHSQVKNLIQLVEWELS